LQRLVNDGVDDLDVASGGDLWNNPAICGMDIYLRVDDIAKKPAAIFDNGGGGFVTTTLDSQNSHLLVVYTRRV